jgi:hypothetical protein
MKHLPLTLALVLALSQLAWSQSPNNAAGTQTVSSNEQFRIVEVDDPAMQMRAGGMLIPADWKFAGTIARVGGCHGNGAQGKWIAQSPDGLTAVAVFPGSTWHDTTSESMARIMSQNGCDPVDITKAATFLQRVVLPDLRPSATVDRVDPLGPEDQAMLKQQLQKLQDNSDAMARQSMQMGLRKLFRPDLHSLDGAIARIHYSINGQEVDETVATIVHCADVWVPGNYVAQPSANRNCNSWPVVVMRAPRGTLDHMRPQLLAIKQTYQVDSNWDYQMGQNIQRQTQQMLAASNAAFNARMEASRAAFAAQSANWAANERARQTSVDNSIANARAQQNARDIEAHQMVLFAGDKQTMINPETGLQYEISNKYAHSYASPDGRQVIQSNQPIDLQTQTGAPYTELQPH